VDRRGCISLASAGELNNNFSVLLAQSQVTFQAELYWLPYMSLAMMTMMTVAVTVVIGIAVLENDITATLN